MKKPSLIIAVACGALAVLLSTGIRQSFGLFQIPIVETIGTDRESFSLAIAVSNLIYGLPLVGILADRYGSRWIIAGGGGLYVVGLFLLTRVSSTGGLVLSMGILVGLALSATTYVVVLGAVSQMVSAARRSQAFGFITAAGSSGMFIVPPVAQFLLDRYGWQMTAITLGLFAGSIALLAFGFPAQPARRAGMLAPEEPFLNILQKARSHTGYLLLISGFFVCGFHVAFISTHLPAYLSDSGLPGQSGATALALIGAFNIAGSYFFGWLGDRFRKKYLLSLIYFLRAICFAAFLLFPLTQVSALVFAGAIGFFWLATVPLTSGTVAQIFGTRYLSSLYGIVFLSHQIGAFLGVWLGGRIFDTTGSYTSVWYMAIGLAFLAAVIHTPISDEPLVQAQPG